VIERFSLPLPQRRAQQQIPRRVAPEGQFRCHHQIGPRRMGLLAGGQQQLGVAGQVSNQGIDLGEGEAHQRRGPAEGCPRP